MILKNKKLKEKIFNTTKKPKKKPTKKTKTLLKAISNFNLIKKRKKAAIKPNKKSNKNKENLASDRRFTTQRTK